MHAIVKEGDHSKECVEAYKNLAQCYKEKRIYQLNACHEKRKLLDKCLDAEYEERYAKNQEEAGRKKKETNCKFKPDYLFKVDGILKYMILVIKILSI
ncbi:hypothetical protein ABK040_012010 [Willaertia magna]